MLYFSNHTKFDGFVLFIKKSLFMSFFAVHFCYQPHDSFRSKCSTCFSTVNMYIKNVRVVFQSVMFTNMATLGEWHLGHSKRNLCS